MRRIDVHQHLLPPADACWLKPKGIHAPGRRELPQRSPEHAIALMDTYAVETAVLSLSTPGTWLGDGAEAAAMAGRSTSAARNSSSTAPTGSGTSSLPAPPVPGLPLFAADFLLDTTPRGGPPAPARRRTPLPQPEDHPVPRGRFPPLYRSPDHRGPGRPDRPR
jgi:hypothetical protein